MVQVLAPIQRAPRQKTSSDKFAEAFGNLGQSAAQLIPEELMGRRERESLGGLIGQDVSNIRNPNFLKEILHQSMERKKQQEKQTGFDQETYDAIKERFGEEEADLYVRETQGGKTVHLKKLFEREERSGKLNEKLSKSPGKSTVIKTPSGKDFELPPINEPTNLTDADKVRYHSELRKENKDIYKTNIDKGRGLKDVEAHLEILDDLNNRMGEGIARLALDKEGNIRPSALRFKAVPKEWERFSKTVNDFLSSAKDTFGARVTNYDISQFKQRLPGLLNSKDGRKEIIQQMQVFNKIERNYRNALNQIYQKYGVGNVPAEEAERLAEEIVAPEEERLRSQLLQIGKEGFDFEELPDPSSSVGRIMEDDQGRKFRSNGQSWEQV